MFNQVLTKARIYMANDMSQYLEFQYNPSEFTDSIGVNWSEIQGAGMSYPILQYAGGKTRTISFSLYLNAKERPGYLRQSINFLHSFLPPARLEGYQFSAPPKMIFSFGWFTKLCVLQEMNIVYNYFSPDLQPLMATVDITLALIQ